MYPFMSEDTNPNAEVYWAMPNGGTPENVTWDQTFSAAGAVDCGVWYQVDLYPKDKIEQLTADGILTNGEDHGIVISWRYEYAGDCAPVEPEPTPTPEPTPEATPTATPTPVVITPAEPPAAPLTETTTVIEPAATDVPTLAETGVGDILMPGILALAFLAAGASMLYKEHLKNQG